MAKLTIMRGLPACGKSTKAKELLEVGNTVRINKDLLRTMLHFDKFGGRNEGMTRDASRTLAGMFLSKGINVIIDDTNLNPGTLQSWIDLAKEHDAKIEHEDMTLVPVWQCVKYDNERRARGERFVGSHVITKMALQYLDYFKDEKAIVCDLDGTLCDISHRLHFARSTPKDWKSFFAAIPQDTPRTDVHKKVADLAFENKAKVIFVSARPENYREETEEWLESNQIIHGTLIMREANDKRPDTEVKSDIYDRYLKHLNIIKVFDDRPRVIRMWREKGLNVEDVGAGIEF